MHNKHEKYELLIARCKSLPPTPTAVAHPCDLTSRADVVTTRLASCAVAVLAANGRRASASKAVG